MNLTIVAAPHATPPAPSYLQLLLLWTLGAIGLCGLHRLRTGRWKSGALYLLTFGLFGVGQLADLLWLRSLARDDRRPLILLRLR